MDAHKIAPAQKDSGKQPRWTPDRLFTVFMLLLLLLGLVIVKDYGVGWDGVFQYKLGEANYKIYQHPFSPKTKESYGPYSHEYHGPFYQTFAYAIKEMTARVVGESHRFEAFAFAYFLAFVLGVACLYPFCKRVMGAWWALAAVLLYATQPVLFGHAFINPKDTPFLGMMLASVYAGLRMVDHYRSPAPAEQRLQPWLGQRWAENPPVQRKRMVNAGLIWLVLSLAIIFLNGYIRLVTDSTVAAILQTPAGSFWYGLAQRVAPNLADIPLQDYQARAAVLVFAVLRWLFWLSFIALLWAAVRMLASDNKRWWFIRQSWSRLNNEPVFHLLLAGFVLGLSGATRALAFFAAGGLVAFYFFIQKRWKSLLPLAVYTLTAALTTYAAWPYLWPAPFTRFYGALTTLSAFPWSGTILYRGSYYTPDTLPREYLPRLISLQFTEPLVLLALVGLALVVYRMLKGSDRAEVSVPLLWFALPFTAALVLKPNIYDNFRHFLFITPPLFVFAGLAMEQIGRFLKQKWLGWALVTLILLPGIVHDIQLHPYQYIYFNGFTGGVAGAFRSYELDYWATSTREAFEYVNRHAESGARVVVWGPENTTRLYARSDLDLVFPDDLPDNVDFSRYDYGVLSSRSNRDQLNVPNAHELFRVQRESATLMVVRQLHEP